MDIDNARELKEKLARQLVQHFGFTSSGRATRGMFAISARSTPEVTGTPLRSIALGVSVRGGNTFGIAVRIQRRELESSPFVEKLIKTAKGEADVRYVGRITKATVPWHQKKCDPLRMGCSVGHFNVTAGTLGAFARWRKATGTKAKQVLILSNNHVLANENDAKVGAAILQPGTLDGGVRPKHVIGRLVEWVELDPKGPNLLDCAAAKLKDGLKVDVKGLKGLTKGSKLTGVGSPLSIDDRVRKVGRTTGATSGKVTAVELDNVVVRYDIGNCRFDNQVEIEGDGSKAFSDGGDSGSLITDESGLARALLFAGSDQGGSNGKGLTFANPIQEVLDTLEIDLLY
jgi:hypothetical protein